MRQFFPVAAVDSLPPGKGRTVHLKGRDFAVYNVSGEFFAIDDSCPHRGGPLGAGFLENDQVYCPLHGWAFNVKTGECLSNPSKPIRSYPTRVENGEVHIGLDE